MSARYTRQYACDGGVLSKHDNFNQSVPVCLGRCRLHCLLCRHSRDENCDFCVNGDIAPNVEQTIRVFYSVFLLVYLSTDRLSAVLRPHTFTLRASRAKMALGVIAVFAAVCTTVVYVAYFLHFGHFARVFILCISLSGIFIMVICYVAMATAMIKNIKSSVHPNVEFHPKMKSSSSGNPTDSVSIVIPKENENTLEHRTTVFPPGKSKTFSKREKHVYKDMMLLFTITFMFAACWIPLWLSFAIAHFPIKLRGSLIFNSAVNPIIYGVVSKMFRDDVRQFCRKTRSKLTTCSH